MDDLLQQKSVHIGRAPDSTPIVAQLRQQHICDLAVEVGPAQAHYVKPTHVTLHWANNRSTEPILVTHLSNITLTLDQWWYTMAN